jgi:hypothetical protein
MYDLDVTCAHVHFLAMCIRYFAFGGEGRGGDEGCEREGVGGQRDHEFQRKKGNGRPRDSIEPARMATIFLPTCAAL